MTEVAKGPRKTTIRRLQDMKRAGTPITALGVYESVTASIADSLGVNIFMTGPSGPMSLFGHTNPMRIGMEEQLCTLRAVSGSTRHALLNAHMPFCSFQASPRDAVLNAARLVSEGGAETVKCDATARLAPNIRAIVDAGIPVIAHMGVQALRHVEQSGYGLKGVTADDAKRLIDDAQTVAETGVFAFLLEHVCADVAEIIAKRISVPVLSLGSGARTDGVCIVSGDLLNYSAVRRPAHAGRMADLAAEIHKGLGLYAGAVRDGSYPSAESAPHMQKEQFEEFIRRQEAQK